MTTFPDPPPHSRRAVRQSERSENPDSIEDRTENDSTQTGSYSFERDGAQNESLRTGEHRAHPAHTGPLPAAPRSGESVDSTDGFRVRDYSPEGRRAAISREHFSGVTSTPPVSPRLESAPPAPPASVDLDYFTQARPADPATPAASDGESEHALTRRELRELRAARERAAPKLELPEPIDNILNSGPITIPVLSVLPGQSQALEDAMAEFDALASSRHDLEPHDLEPQDVAPVDVPAPALVPPPALVEPALSTGAIDLTSANPQFASLADLAPSLAESEDTPAASPLVSVWSRPSAEPAAAAAEPAASTPEPTAPAEAPVHTTASPLPPLAAAPPASAPVPLQPPSVFAPVVEPGHGSVDPVFLEPERAVRPVGHWSVQAELDDEDLEKTVSRTVGAGTAAITTSALVLPSVPEMSDLIHSFNSTGEILVTGTIDLPRSLGSTGAHPHRVDNSDFEDDPLDSQVVSTDSAPVRAIRAISTHTSTRGTVETKRRPGNRLPTIMIIAASVLAVGVVGLLIVAAVTHLF